MKPFIIASAIIFAWLYGDLVNSLRYVPVLALAAIPVAVVGLCIGLVTDAATILATIAASYGLFVVLLALGGLIGRRARGRPAA